MSHHVKNDNNENNAKEHWEDIYYTKNFNEVSWYQSDPKTSVNLILSVSSNKNDHIIDVGGGDSNIVDKLIDLNYKKITVLDISIKALKKSQQRLGTRADIVKWISTDIRKFETDDRFDVWHDRALFHFLISKKDVNKYIKLVRKLLNKNGYLIIGTFSLKGPEDCSGLDIKQYSEESMKRVFNIGFKHIKSLEEIHKTPI